MINTYESVERAVHRTRELVLTAQRLDNAEMYLVLNSEVLTSMSCTYNAALYMARQRRDALAGQLDRELARIVAALAVLRGSRDVPARLAEATSQWRRNASHVADLAEQVEAVESRNTTWTGRAQSYKSAAVERQFKATEQFSQSLEDLSAVTAKGELLIGLILSTAALEVNGCNARLGGFIGRSPSVNVGLWGMFQRTSGAIGHVRASANMMTRHVSRHADWRSTSASLRDRLEKISAGTDELPAKGWPEPVAKA